MKTSSIYYKVRIAAVLLLLLTSVFNAADAKIIRFVYVSDSHYGLYRTFRGQQDVSSAAVNHALLEKVNMLPTLALPADGGVGGGTRIGEIDFVVNTGDIANRMEKGVQTAAESWKQFADDWYGFLSVWNSEGEKSPLYLLPGNHDASNAIGFPKPMSPKTDATTMAEIYNRMMKPAVRRTAETYSYATGKVHYSFDYDGVHFVFAGIWPDTKTRRWIDADLDKINPDEPAILFVHDQPDVEAKHFINPNGSHDLNKTDLFENLLTDTSSVYGKKEIPAKERSALASFLMSHKAIKAYFHGNENYNEFYVWKNEGQAILPVFRVDSPMKGVYSSEDEKKLSFIFVCIDTDSRLMTVRECLWNTGDGVEWGESSTVSLR